MLDGEWIVVKDAGTLQPVHTTLEVRKPSNLVRQTEAFDCQQAVEIISCKTTGTASSLLKAGQSKSVKPDDSRFFSENAWLFEGLRRELDSNKWHAYTPVESSINCRTCAPEKPSLRWKPGTTPGTIAPEEDVSSANKYERSIKRRPPCLVVEAQQDDYQLSKIVQVKLGINVESMAHRARARLPDSVANVQYSWRLRTNFNPSQSFSFRPFRLNSNKDTDPYDGNLDLGIERLFSNQSRSLTWMEDQEAEIGRKCLVEESEEAHLPYLGWSVEMRAKAWMHVRGGICADLPGYGKTILSLALIKSQFLRQQPSEIRRELEDHQKSSAQGLFPSSATLIVCPRTLVHQWVSEAKEKLGYDQGIIAVKNVLDLERTSIEEMQNARIIVASSAIFSSDTYPELVGAFSAIPGPAATWGRTFGEWLKFARKAVPEHLRTLNTSGWDALRELLTRKYKENITRAIQGQSSSPLFA